MPVNASESVRFLFFFVCVCVCVCVCADLLKRSKTCQVFDSRGVRLIIPTWRNEAMVWWGMGGLINHLYLLHGHDEGDVQTLVTRVSFLGFCFKLLVPTHWRWNMHHYHEPGTECAISLIQVCILWWMSDKVPQGRGADPVQLLSRRKYDWEKLNVEFTIFNLVIRLSILHRVLLPCQPFQMCMSWANLIPIVSPVSIWSCFLVLNSWLRLASVLKPPFFLPSSSWRPSIKTSVHEAYVCRWFSFFLVFGEVQMCINSRLNWQPSRV